MAELLRTTPLYCMLTPNSYTAKHTYIYLIIDLYSPTNWGMQQWVDLDRTLCLLICY